MNEWILLFKCRTDINNDVEAVYLVGFNVCGYYKESGIRPITARLQLELFNNYIDHEGHKPMNPLNPVVIVKRPHETKEMTLQDYFNTQISEPKYVYIK